MDRSMFTPELRYLTRSCCGRAGSAVLHQPLAAARRRARR